MKIWQQLLKSCLGLACCATQAVDFITSDTIWDYTGEHTASGYVRSDIVDAPQVPGKKSLKLEFFKDKVMTDWLDVIRRIEERADWTNEDFLVFDYYACTPNVPLWVKVSSDGATNTNSVLIEHQIFIDGKPPKAGQWHHIALPLPKDPAARKSIRAVSVYIPCSGDVLPKDQKIVFYLGIVDYKVKPRVPWPPQSNTLSRRYTTVWNAPVNDKAPFIKVADGNNKNSHTADFRDGAIAFNSTVNGWNEFAWSDHRRLIMQPQTTYRLDFDYEITDSLTGPNCIFYSLVRCGEAITKDVGWQQWGGAVGTKGHRSVIFKTLDYPDYRLIFGVRDQGGILIRNIHLRKIEK